MIGVCQFNHTFQKARRHIPYRGKKNAFKERIHILKKIVFFRQIFAQAQINAHLQYFHYYLNCTIFTVSHNFKERLIDDNNSNKDNDNMMQYFSN